MCLYILNNNGQLCYILIHVDDIIVASKANETLEDFGRILSSKFEINNLGDIRSYLCMEVQRNGDGCFGINQKTYIMKIVNDFGLVDAKPSYIPMNVSYRKENSTDVLISNEKYRKLIGSLLYVTVNTRPDIAVSVGILSQKVEKPTQEDWNELKRVVKYLEAPQVYR